MTENGKPQRDKRVKKQRQGLIHRLALHLYACQLFVFCGGTTRSMRGGGVPCLGWVSLVARIPPPHCLLSWCFEHRPLFFLVFDICPCSARCLVVVRET